MSRVITFSRTFPSYHPRKNELTYFVERIWDATMVPSQDDFPGLNDERINYAFLEPARSFPKHHTIRRGHRFKPGDKFSPRVWSGMPYRSKQIAIAPDIEVVKTWDFAIDAHGNYLIDGKKGSFNTLLNIAENDGFEALDDFELWFNVKLHQTFDGQIICWSDLIDYSK